MRRPAASGARSARPLGGAGAAGIGSLATVRLGLRLATAGGRAGVVRLGLMTGGVALGVALLLGVAGVGPALANHEARLAAQSPYCKPPAAGEARFSGYTGQMAACQVVARAPNHLEVLTNPGDSFRGRSLTRVLIAVVGSSSGLGRPPGVARLPGPGQLVVSPALARLLGSPGGALLRPRLAGRVTGTIGRSGLVYPGELLAYMGSKLPPRPASGGWQPATGFGTPPSPAGTRQSPVLPASLVLFVVLGSVVVLSPVLAFVTTATRLSAATRERRLATLRLLGATPAQVRLLLATEAGLAAVAGSIAGAGLLVAGRQLLPFLLPGVLMVFPSELSPQPSFVLAVLVAVPVLALVAGLVSLRRVELTPLGVQRRARPPRERRAGLWRLAPLALGFAGLATMVGYRHALSASNHFLLPRLSLAGSTLLVVVGVIVAGPWVGVVLAGPLARRTRSAGALLGARRLQLEPTSTARIAGGVAVVAFAATAMLELAPYFDRVPASGAPASPGLMVVQSAHPTKPFLARLAGLAGVGAVVPVESLEAAGQPTAGQPSAGQPTAGAAGQPWTVNVVSCAGMHLVLGARAPHCSAGAPAGFYPAGQLQVSPSVVRPFVEQQTAATGGQTGTGAPPPAPGSRPFVPFPLPGRLIPVPSLAGLSTNSIPGFGYGLMLTTSAVPRAVWASMLPSSLTTVVVSTHSWRARQRVRDLVAARSPGAYVMAERQIVSGSNQLQHEVARAVDVGLALVLVVASAGLLIETLDALAERRRPLAVLAATGVSRRTLAASVVVATGLPLLGAVALAEAAALGAAALFQLLVLAHLRLAIVPAAMTAAGGLVGVALVTLATLPSVALSHGAEGLRAD